MMEKTWRQEAEVADHSQEAEREQKVGLYYRTSRLEHSDPLAPCDFQLRVPQPSKRVSPA